MKKNSVLTLCVLIPFVAFSCAKPQEDKPIDESEKVHLIVLAGQSGARGKALVNDLSSDYKEINEDVDIIADGLTMDKLVNIPDGINEDNYINVLKPGYGDYPSEVGPELGMGKTLASRYQKLEGDYKTVIVKYTASGSTFLNHWYSASSIKDSSISNKLDLSQVRTYKNNQTGPLTSNLYKLIDFTIENLVVEGYKPIIDGIAFIHGEQDAKFDANMDIYEKALTYFVSDFRNYVNNQNLPFVITEALTNSAKYSNKSREIQSRVASNISNVSFVSNESLYTNTFEPWHFNASSNNVLGNRIAADIVSYNDNREIKTINETIKVPKGVLVSLPQYLKASFTNYYDGYVKVNQYINSYDPNTLGEQNVTFNVNTIDGLKEHSLKVVVENNTAYIDGVLNEYESAKQNNLPNGKGTLFIKKSNTGLYFAASINDNEIYTDGESWHRGDMGQAGNNDDLRIYVTDSSADKHQMICLSSANLLRVYKEGISLTDSEIVLEQNNMVYQKQISDYQFRVIGKGIFNDGQKSNGLMMELFVSYKDLGIENTDNIKILANYNDVGMVGSEKKNTDNYLLKEEKIGVNDYENYDDCYFSINDLI